MSIWSRLKKKDPPRETYDPALLRPVIRASICTGEKTACMRDRESGKLHEIMLVRTEEDMDTFCRMCSADKETMKTVY